MLFCQGWRWCQDGIPQVDVGLGVPVEDYDRIAEHVLVVDQLILLVGHVHAVVSIPVQQDHSYLIKLVVQFETISLHFWKNFQHNFT